MSFTLFPVSAKHIFESHATAVVKNSARVDLDGDLGDNVTENE